MAFSHVKSRDYHENLMHATLVHDAAARLVNTILATNSGHINKNLIKTAYGTFSYIDAKAMMIRTDDSAKAVSNIFERIVENYFQNNPDFGVRELLSATEFKLKE